MTQHYYNEHPVTRSNEQVFNTEISGRSFSFVSDHGVFSKEGVDFGSRFLVETFTEPDIAGPLLDMGCGYGAMGIMLANITGRHVTLSDVNQRAVELARQNAARNEAYAVQVVSGDLFSGVADSERFAAIVINPPIRAGKAVVYRMLSDARAYLLPGGELWIVIQKKQGAPSAKRKLQDMYEEVVEVDKDKGYRVFRARGLEKD
ncbi:class I SAM-dependent methyltransferase [Natribacillus halophilus]|uniref:16S rRNA m(2)G 1207 methyltransferase n=1 Tax=Natribacillus halophilus TaxID=549003 RepID=A0A1G8QX31_9BACI|nr:methyltransferase [Natribacillus halophilus]SDJ09309.1 16S rRNA m(2)G 1207 methyltransferase [Natribacillus halophilus]